MTTIDTSGRDSMGIIATCGHEVNNGLNFSIKSWDRDGNKCIEFGTYCVACAIQFYKEGRIANREMEVLIGTILAYEKQIEETNKLITSTREVKDGRIRFLEGVIAGLKSEHA